MKRTSRKYTTFVLFWYGHLLKLIYLEISRRTRSVIMITHWLMILVHNLTNHLMVDLQTIIAIASKLYRLIDNGLYRLRCLWSFRGIKKVFNDFINKCWVLHYTYGSGLLLFKCIFVYICLWLYMNVVCFCLYISSLVHFIIHWFFKVCCQRTWFLVINERCTPK